MSHGGCTAYSYPSILQSFLVSTLVPAEPRFVSRPFGASRISIIRLKDRSHSTLPSSTSASDPSEKGDLRKRRSPREGARHGRGLEDSSGLGSACDPRANAKGAESLEAGLGGLEREG